jgi:NADH-quinone oxidoreductase subunit H
MNSLVEAQNVWFVLTAPLAALIFVISSQAEVGRAPFDLLEAESEIVTGYQIEYSGLKFGMFYVGEFLHAFTISALTAALFLGGWRGPWAEQAPILGIGYFFAKAMVVYFFVILARIALPRLRIDQMLNFNWKFLTPLALVLVMTTAVVEKVLNIYNISAVEAPLAHTLVHLLANLILLWIMSRLLRRRARYEPKRVGEPRPVAVSPVTPSSVIE